MLLKIDAKLDDWHSFAFKKFFLQRGVRLADEDFAVGAEDAMPGDAFAARSGAHGAACGAGAAAKVQSFSKASVG